MATFFTPRMNVVESDEGFSVEVLGETGLLYTDAEGVFTADAELLAGPAGLVVYSNSIHQMGPEGDGAMELTRRQEIVENIRRALRFRGFEIEVI